MHELRAIRGYARRVRVVRGRVAHPGRAPAAVAYRPEAAPRSHLGRSVRVALGSSFPEARARNSRKRTHKRKNSSTEKQIDQQATQLSPNYEATPDNKKNLAKKPEGENISQKQKSVFTVNKGQESSKNRIEATTDSSRKSSNKASEILSTSFGARRNEKVVLSTTQPVVIMPTIIPIRRTTQNLEASTKPDHSNYQKRTKSSITSTTETTTTTTTTYKATSTTISSTTTSTTTTTTTTTTTSTTTTTTTTTTEASTEETTSGALVNLLYSSFLVILLFV